MEPARFKSAWRLGALLPLVACNLLSGPSTPAATQPPTPTALAPTPAASPTRPATPTAEPVAPPTHEIGIRLVDSQAQFFVRDSGQPFVPRGVNYVFVPEGGGYSNLPLKVGVYDPARTRADFANLAAYGFNTLRVFLDQCNAGPGCIGDDDNLGLNPAYLSNIADMLAAAQETGLYILFTSNDLPDQGGYAEQANAQSGPIFAGYRNSYYLTPGAVTATRRYWRDLLSGLHTRRAPTQRVLGWQLVNEQWLFVDQPPLSLASGIVETTTGRYDMADPAQKRAMVSDGLIHYIAEVRAEILAHDPTALITMGFFAPEIAAPQWYVDTAPLLAGSDLDFFDFHAYPGAHAWPEIVEAFGMTGYTAKPIILGEYGAFRHVYPTIAPAARSVTEWQAQSCDYGFDGWLYWTYYPAGPSVGDRTWGLVDESGLLLEMLAPSLHPDPCEVATVASDNLAFQKPVQASASLAAELPGNAVDENAVTQWGAGAHPPQWIEIDLQATYRLSQVRLLVAQFPEGDTVHRLRARSAGGDYVEIHTFSQNTKDGDWLVILFEAPVENVRYVRVDTLSGPSWVAWREIELYGQPDE